MALILDGTTGITSDGGTPVIENLNTTATGIDITGEVTSDGLTVDSTTLVVDEANNRVGIGTSSPTRTLEVRGGFSASSSSQQILLLSDFAENRIYSRDSSTGDYPLAIYTGVTERLRILSSGGITFNGDTAAANALDDYEEGTWTPFVYSGTATIKDVSGTYTKIGNRVIASFGFSGNATGTISIIGGLPFTSNQNTNGAAREIQNTGFLWSAQVVSSSTRFGFRRYDNNSTLTANDVYVGMMVYQV
jgi:hypothetical protein